MPFAIVVNRQEVFLSHRQVLYSALESSDIVDVYNKHNKMDYLWIINAYISCIFKPYRKIFISTPIAILAMSLLPSVTKKKTVVLITGLGTMYQKGGVLKSLLMSSIRSYRRHSHFVVQNTDDLLILRQMGCDVSLFRGSGVKWQDYRAPLKSSESSFLLATRLLKSKGVMDYVRAAEDASVKYPESKFFIVGDYDSNHPASISEQDFRILMSSGCIYLGRMPNTELLTLIRTEIDYCVLPSEREGMSKFLLESISMGIPVITCRTPGGRDLINLGLAYGVEYGDHQQLASLFVRLIKDSKSVRESKISELSHASVKDKFDNEAFKKFILDLI